MLTHIDQYSFDGVAITITTSDPDRKESAAQQKWVPCEHLKPLLASALACGARIESAETGWTQAKLVVTLTKGPNPGIAQAVATDRGLSFYQNNDSHYLVAYGWFCDACSHGLDWPQQQATMDAI